MKEIIKGLEDLLWNHRSAEGDKKLESVLSQAIKALQAMEEAGEEDMELLYSTLEAGLYDFSLSYQYGDYESGETLRLVDVLTPEGDKDISRGQAEITFLSELLVDQIQPIIAKKNMRIKELEQENKEFKWIIAGYVTDLNKSEQENKKLKEQLKEKLKLPKKLGTEERKCYYYNYGLGYNKAIEDTKKLNGLTKEVRNGKN